MKPYFFFLHHNRMRSGSICPMFVFLFFNFMLFCSHQNVSVGDKSRSLAAAVSMGFADWIPPLSFSHHKTHPGSLFILRALITSVTSAGKCDRPIQFCEFIFDHGDATTGGEKKKGRGCDTDVTWRPLFQVAIRWTSAAPLAIRCVAVLLQHRSRVRLRFKKKNPRGKFLFLDRLARLFLSPCCGKRLI